jgi:hypothetical protein
MAELPKPRDLSVDLCVLETKENELNCSNIDETENESTVSSSYVNNQTIETNSQNQTTYAEVTKSHPPAGNNHKAANEIHAENNQVKCNKLSSGLTSDDFIGVDRKRKRNKSFFLSGMDENVKESQIYSYMAKRNID